MGYKYSDPTNTTFIEKICVKTSCNKHKAPVNISCFTIISEAGKEYHAVCNSRAKRAGYNGVVSDAN